jgi:hypothetical protein
MQQATNTYPNQQIDPREKGYDWILQYAKAAWGDSRGYVPNNMLNFGQSKMNEIKEYALGRQSTTKYKKLLNVDEQTDKTWLNTDWTPPSFITKFREIAISKLVQRRYDIQAFAVDPLAKSEEDQYFNEMKVKIMMRDAAMKAGNEELANSPVLRPHQGEAQDLEQLLMEQQFGYKHIMAMEAESCISLTMYKNKFDEKRKRTIENLFDFGIGGYTEYIDENGAVNVREVNPENLVLSYCSKNDFSDLVHWGEVREVYVGDLAPYFTPDQLNLIVQSVAGRFGNPSNFMYGTDYSKYWNRFKVLILDFEFLSWNDYTYKSEIDNRGNERFGKTKYQDATKIPDLAVNEKGTIEKFNYAGTVPSLVDSKSKGQAEPMFLPVTKKVVYKCKWLIQTDYMYDWGMSENQIRQPSSWWDTKLNIQLYSWNFYKMRFAGITERLIPLEDKACLAWFRLQNMSNKLIPYLINIDLNALEGIDFGGAGGKMEPTKVMDFIFSNFVVPYRSTDLLSQNPNYKPVSIEASGQLAVFGQLYQELQNTIDMMRQISGLNELTDGSTPNAKTLVPVANAAMESTNNALYLLSFADKQLVQNVADAIVAKVQIAVKLGKVEGYAKALGDETVKFMQINPNLSIHEFGIFIEDSPVDFERQQLIQELNIRDSQGLIEPEDKILVMSCRNLKMASMILAYRIKKRREKMQEYELQKLQQASQGNAMAAQKAEEQKRITLQAQLDADIAKINAEMQWQYIIQMGKKDKDLEEAEVQKEAKIIAQRIAADAKIAISDKKQIQTPKMK